MKYKEMTPKF